MRAAAVRLSINWLATGCGKNSMTLTGWEHTRRLESSASQAALRYNAVRIRARGWMPRRNFAGLQLEGEIFLLTSPFIEPNAGSLKFPAESRSGQRKISARGLTGAGVAISRC